MGGLGSGRPRGSGRRLVENCRTLDANQLHGMGSLRPGATSNARWGEDDTKESAITLHAETDQLHLSYRARVGGTWEDMSEIVALNRVPCRFGGQRVYFLCPGVVNGIACGRRVVKLYGVGHWFLCRHCHRLGHACQSASELQRCLRRGHRIRRRFGDDSHRLVPVPPKGMALSTYAQLLDQVLAAELRIDEAGTRQLERLLTQIDKWSKRAVRARRGS
jgi:hypothetical protein